MAKRQWRESSPETKMKQSLKKQGCNNPNYGGKITKSDEVRKKISDSLKLYWQNLPSKNDNPN
ncbi:NUMOD3 domain-containing DNA-binding protein [Dysgonomonas sp. 521]|uniref:NUMOD3 domain-containing DNA-binding protein n=1 Tax=Dysgonomonas sp. 521 TaxID=2302932 RepID=UPI0013D7FE72|nr:NUMOD3 domain-containing DNA-binding protein [Dysgonomonas sp. 521]